MPIYPFERTVFPSRFLSPFISRNGKAVVKGPGGLVPEALEQHREDGDKEEPARKRTRRNPGGDAGPSKGLFVGSSVPGTNAVAALSHYQYQPPNLAHQTQQPARGGIGDRSIITAVGGGSNAHVDKLPSETSVLGYMIHHAELMFLLLIFPQPSTLTGIRRPMRCFGSLLLP